MMIISDLSYIHTGIAIVLYYSFPTADVLNESVQVNTSKLDGDESIHVFIALGLLYTSINEGINIIN